MVAHACGGGLTLTHQARPRQAPATLNALQSRWIYPSP